MKKHLLVCVLIVGLALMSASSAFAVPAAEPDEPQAPTDFNGDWYADLAIGVPDENIGSVADAGAVNILYGGRGAGLSTQNNRVWSQDEAGVVDQAETEDEMGNRLAVGDFNGDGFYDLAAGVQQEDIGAVNAAGAVHIFYGSKTGLTAAGNELLSQNTLGVLDAAESGDEFGRALAVGDFDRDGYDDLAVGVPYEDVGGPAINDAGAVNVFYGSAAGLSTRDQFWHQDVTNIEGVAEADDNFGFALAAGDFDRNGYADLAIGVPHENVGAIVDAGAVNVLYGSASGLTTAGDEIWTQDSTGIEDTSEANDNFGYALTAGDFNRDGRADLAVGAPYESVGALAEAGAVNVLYGAAGGLTSANDELWHQGIAGVEGGAEAGDWFGWRLTAGDFNGDGRADLAVGVPHEDVGAIANAGAVNVLYGAASGLTATGDQIWDQDSPGIQETAEANDEFGRALAAGDFDGDGYADLAVGVPYEDIGGPAIDGAGAVQVLYGSAAGLGSAGDQLWHQDVPDVAGGAEDGDNFGYALAAIPRTTHRLYLPLIRR